MATDKYVNDFKLIDGNKIVRGHKSEYDLEGFLVVALEKIKYLSMHFALTEEQANVLLDCMIDEHFAFGGDMKGFENFVERIGSFLDYYLDRLSESAQITDENTMLNAIGNLRIFKELAEAEEQPF